MSILRFLHRLGRSQPERQPGELDGVVGTPRVRRWTLRLYDKDGVLKSEADFGTQEERDACVADLEQMVAMGGGRLEMEGPEES